MSKLIPGNEFSIVLLLKTEPSLRKRSFAVVDAFRKTSNQETKETRCEKTFYLLGKYDVGAVLTGTDLGAISRLSYLILQQLEDHCPGSLRDFTRIPAFRWPVRVRVAEKPTVGIIQVKLTHPLMSFRDKGSTLIEAISALDSYNFSLYGGLAWYEIIIDLKGASFDTIPRFLARIVDAAPNRKLIGEISTIPAWEPHKEYRHFSMNLSLSLKFHDFMKYDLIRQSIPEAVPSLGFVDLQVAKHVSSIKDIETCLSALEDRDDSIGVRRYSSNLQFSSDKLPLSPESSFAASSSVQRASNAPSDSISSPGVESNVVDTSFHRNKTTLHERIDAVRTQIQVLRNDNRFRYLIQSRLLDTLEALEFDSPSFHSPSDVAGYISTLRHAIHQRLAGTYPTAATGIVTGYADGYGGYQRIILAAEALLSRCLKIMLGGVFRIPPVLVLFDQRGLHQYDFNIYEAVRKVNKGAPLIVRLKMLKYEPWYWHRGIRDIALWCVELERFFRKEISHTRFLDLSASRPGDFACRMLSRDLYIKLRAFEGSTPVARAASPDHSDHYTFSRRAYENLRKEVAGCQEIAYDEDFTENRVHYFSDSLLEGEIFSGELQDDIEFRHFVNAYYSLPLASRGVPRTMTAFILSLYSNYRFTEPELDSGDSSGQVDQSHNLQFNG